MSTATTADTGSTGIAGVVALAAMALGVLVVGYGVLVLPQSGLGGAWIIAIGLSLALAGFFSTDFAAEQMDLAPKTQRTLSLGFAVLSVFLLGSFVALNFASFEAGSASGSGTGA